MPVIKIRRGTTEQWAASNRVLQLAELGLDTTLNKIKAGNGTTAWSSLPFLQADVDITELAQDAVATALANGTHSNITVTYDDNDNSISLATGSDVVTTTSLSNTLTDSTTGYVPIGDVGQADGVASLDSDGKIPDSEIPDTIARDSEIPSLDGYATETYVGTAISNLIDTAPETLNTLNELAAALGDDANYASTISTALGDKEPLLPSVADNSGKFLTTDGTAKSWAIIPSATPTARGTVFGRTGTLYNVSLGENALPALTTGAANIAIGDFSQNETTDQISNISIGYNTLISLAEDSNLNVAIGTNALGGAGTLNGDNNVALGGNAGYGGLTGSNNTLLGANAMPSNSTISNEITLGNADITKFRIPGLAIDWSTSNVPVLQSEPAIDYYITNNGSGSYTVNGVANGPVEFIKGKKYRIHINASGHPFWIQTVSGSYSSGNVYSTGITGNGTQVGHIIVELPQDAPDNLYYVCQFHSSMAGAVLVRTDNVSFNPQSSSYTLTTSDSKRLIEMSGGGTLTITDSSSFPVGFTCDVLQTTASQVTIAGTSFTPNATPGLKLRAQWSSATLIKRALNSWVVMGDLSA
jgi:hypothetical protein